MRWRTASSITPRDGPRNSLLCRAAAQKRTARTWEASASLTRFRASSALGSQAMLADLSGMVVDELEFGATAAIFGSAKRSCSRPLPRE